MSRDGGHELVDLILMRRLTKCILANEHRPTTILEKVYDHRFGIMKDRIVDWVPCPRCGIGRGYTWSYFYSGVTALL